MIHKNAAVHIWLRWKGMHAILGLFSTEDNLRTEKNKTKIEKEKN